MFENIFNDEPDERPNALPDPLRQYLEEAKAIVAPLLERGHFNPPPLEFLVRQFNLTKDECAPPIEQLLNAGWRIHFDQTLAATWIVVLCREKKDAPESDQPALFQP